MKYEALVPLAESQPAGELAPRLGTVAALLSKRRIEGVTLYHMCTFIHDDFGAGTKAYEARTTMFYPNTSCMMSSS